MAKSAAEIAKKQVVIQVQGFAAGYDGNPILQGRQLRYPLRGGVLHRGSGSGKSTLLKHMIGLLRPAAGRILINGTDMAVATGVERRALAARPSAWPSRAGRCLAP